MYSLKFKYPGLRGLNADKAPLLLNHRAIDPKHQQEVERLKALIIDTIHQVPLETTQVIVHQSERISLGSDYKSAEDQAISKSLSDEPFYQRVCDALKVDSDIIKHLDSEERFNNASFSVSEIMLRKGEPGSYEYFSQLEVRLDWTPSKLRCTIL